MKISNIKKHIEKIKTELKALKKELEPKDISDIITTVNRLTSATRACNLYPTEVFVSPDICNTIERLASPVLYDGPLYGKPSSLMGLPLTIKEDRYNHISIGVSECQEQ